MPESNFRSEKMVTSNSQTGSNDLKTIIFLLSKHWYWFLIVAVMALILVRLYINHTLPVYHTAAAILINETEGRSSYSRDLDILQGLGLPGGMNHIEDQIAVLKSLALIERSLKDLAFDIEFYTKGLRNEVSLYPVVPLRISYENEIPIPKDIEFLINYNGENLFTIESREKMFDYSQTARFGDTLEIEGGKFVIECKNPDWLRNHTDLDLYFMVHSRTKLVRTYSKRLNVELISREGSVLKVSINGTNRLKDMDFLNKHIEKFQAISLERKNSEADRRIQFIDNQLIGISDSLLLTENQLQQFRSSHRVMDLTAQGQVLIEQVTVLENERARLNLEANYYDYLADYLSKDESGEVPIIPMTMGITDPGLTRLVEELAELQSQFSSRGTGAMNPLQRNLTQRIRTAKEALRETLNGLRRANGLARSENQEQLNRINSRASSLPYTERQLLGIERKFRLNDEIYTFLLETRAEQEMQKAANRADSEIIDPADARFSAQVSPDPFMLYLAGLVGSLGLTFIFFFLRSSLSNSIKDEEVALMTDLPVIGQVPRSPIKHNTVLYEDPNSSTSEAFRKIRSKMQFLTKESRTPVILITSPMPGDGKTFTAINLASAYSLLGKRTILVGYDLRKPKIYQDFKLTNEKGVSTWLIGEDQVSDVIQKTNYDNLSIISSGPVPPNPSELTELEKTAELLTTLKQKFDCIIIDSSPIGIVSDTYHLASLSDSCLIVIRPGQTHKNVFINTLNEIKGSSIRSLGLIINDIKPNSKYYGYGDKYGYSANTDKHERSFARRVSRKVKK